MLDGVDGADGVDGLSLENWLPSLMTEVSETNEPGPGAGELLLQHGDTFLQRKT